MITRITQTDVTTITNDDDLHVCIEQELVPELEELHRVRFIKPNRDFHERLAISLEISPALVVIIGVDRSLTPMELEPGDVVTIKPMSARTNDKHKRRLW